MEYLMTYGWALLVIVIVIAILLIMNPFSAPQSCRFDQVGFTCENPALDTDNFLYMKISNGNNNAVNIYEVKCVASKSATPPEPTSPLPSPTLVGRQDAYEITKLAHSVKCTDAPTGKGAEFSGKIWVFYNNVEDGSDYPVRSASANIVTKVV